MSRYSYILLIAIAPLLCVACGDTTPTGPSIAVTIHPLAAIVSELCEGRAEVHCLTRPGMSPHTYEPRPSDARAASNALALLYVAEDVDRWAMDVPAREHIEVFALLPENARLPYKETTHDHDADDHSHEGHWNPHFWGDPRAALALLPPLTAKLTALDPEGAKTYAENAARFEDKLLALDIEMTETLAPVSEQVVAVLHPSWDYFFHRYGIEVAGAITPYPGKEPTRNYLDDLIDRLVAAKVRAICTEVQLQRRPAEVVATAFAQRTDTPAPTLCEIDPIGGVSGRQSYAELLRYNAAQLKAALE